MALIHQVRPLWSSLPTSAGERSHSETWVGCILYLTTYQIVACGRFLYELG
jgi:hypothetical protein